jgi:hypothetical protein
LTPVKSRQYAWDEVVKVCKGYCVAGMEGIAEARKEAGNTKPFRFMYMSGRGTVQDLTKKPMIMGDYVLLRVSTNLTLPVLTRTKDSDYSHRVKQRTLLETLLMNSIRVERHL